MIPIQINNNKLNNLQSINMGNNFELINGKTGIACNNYNGNLNSWTYGLNNDFKQKLNKEYMNIGKLAQFETVNSPYYTQVKIDSNYLNYLNRVTNCKY